ncbi:MAG: serine/threonine protein kinase, partial [Planctomycetes bacterium]|nr:serine/threonine protein kinase [Planctomycetota bacterium]
ESEPAGQAHLQACPACRARLAALQGRDEELLRELRQVARGPADVPRIPGYRLEGELFRGGQGVVYRAVQEATSRVVALKLLHPAAGPRATLSARERRRFEREVELGSRLTHPGIVTVFDSGVAEGLPWYAMELVDGETLDAYVARARPELAQRLALFLELCAAVAHAHRSGVIHRDLKPLNVLVDHTGRVRVLDFGTALPLDARRLTAPGEFLGTLAYASPEQVGGAEPGDTRTDVYSLGVVLYELVTGALPIDVQGSLGEIVARIASAPPRPAVGVERDLALILATALEKERERRYPSVEAFARDVRHFLAHEPIEARAHSAGYVLGKALRRHRRAVALGATALVLGALFAGAYVRERWNARRATEQSALVRAVFEDILSAAAPQRMGGDAPLRDVLALAAKEIESTLEDAPDAQAAVQLTIGDTYKQLLMFAEAEGHLRLALQRFREVDAGGLETARCLEVLGAVLAALDRPEAVALSEEALTLRRARLEPGDPRIAQSERALAVALLAQDRGADLERAHTLLDAARARFVAALGPEHPEVAETELALARLATWQNDPKAEGLFLHARATLERHAGEAPRDPRLIECLTDYSGYLIGRQRLDEADVVLARAEELTRALYGDEMTSDLLRRRAFVAQARDELESAAKLTRRALSFELARWAASRPEEAAEITRVAAELSTDAAAPYLRAFQLLRRFRGDGAFELATWMNRLAQLREKQGHAEESEALLREALHIHCRAWGSDCPIRQGTLAELGGLLVREQRLDEARALLEESRAIAVKHAAGDEVVRVDKLLSCCPPGSAKESP